VAYPTEDLELIGFDCHSLSTAITMSATSQFRRKVIMGDRQALGEALDDRHQTRSVRLTGGEKSEHEGMLEEGS
jgi:hypothetical protein